MNNRSSMYKRHRFPPEIIQYVVWLYHRFKLSIVNSIKHAAHRVRFTGLAILPAQKSQE